MRPGTYGKTLLLFLLLFILSVLFIENYVVRDIRKNQVDTMIAALSVKAAILKDTVPFEDPGGLFAFCKDQGEATGLRITAIDGQGTVLCDSFEVPGTMRNLGHRREIQKALASDHGWAEDTSRESGVHSLYVAKAVKQNGGLAGFIRLAAPLSAVDSTVNSLRMKIYFALSLLFIVAVVVFLRHEAVTARHVRQIRDHVGALATGVFRKKLLLEGAGVFTGLANELNEMSSELEQSIRKGGEEASRLNVILKSIPDSLLLINIEGVIDLSNSAARDLFDGQELDGRPFIEIIRNTDFYSLIEEVKEKRQPGSTELVLGIEEEKNFLVRVSPLFYQIGQLSGLVAIFHDTTQMKKLEQMRKDFVANVSHEIKTPVTAIQGFSETLLDGALEDRKNAEKFLETIKSHSLRLNRLVDDLLMISKIELGVIRINKKEVHLADIIDTVLNTVSVHASSKNLVLKKNISSSEVVVQADRDRVEQILLNLADNAIKFTEAGEIEIGISEEKGRHVLSVRDSGIGVPHKFISRLGERFFRVDPSRSRELGGTGLGLAIVKHLVKAHGWDMQIDSSPGEGTTVKVYYSS